MNRDALLVYLRDLRDLELAKLSLPAIHAQGAVALLQDAYALDLIPSSYRNLTFVYYLYDTMSTSLVTMADALRPERLAAGTQNVWRPAPSRCWRSCVWTPNSILPPSSSPDSKRRVCQKLSNPPSNSSPTWLRPLNLKRNGRNMPRFTFFTDVPTSSSPNWLEKDHLSQRWSFLMPRKISKTPPPLGRSCPRWCVLRRTTLG